MPLITTAHESLPYIDPEPPTTDRTAAQALISAEFSSTTSSSSSIIDQDSTTHPLLPPLSLPTPTPLIASEYARIEAHIPISGIDTSRYEELSAPPPGTAESVESWRGLLARAYTSQEYLGSRLKQLQALEAGGKEEWLASNEGLVALLGGLERELQGAKEGIDRVVLERQAAQEAVKGEIGMLEKSWKDGVGRVLETEVAAEALRYQILEERRKGASG